MQTERQGRTIVYHAQGQGPRIILSASLGREASDFNELASALVRAGYRTLAVEAPGIGGSNLPEGKMSLFDLADDLKAVIEYDGAGAEADNVFLIGHAFGNRVVRAMATKYPQKIESVALIAAGGQEPVSEDAKVALKNGFNPLRPAGARLKDVQYAFFADGNSPPDYWRRGWHRHTAILQGAATGATESDDWQAAGDRPILVIQAANDRIAPKADTSDILKARYPDRVTVIVIENAGHALLPEQPTAIANAVLDYLAEDSE